MTKWHDVKSFDKKVLQKKFDKQIGLNHSIKSDSYSLCMFYEYDSHIYFWTIVGGMIVIHYRIHNTIIACNTNHESCASLTQVLWADAWDLLTEGFSLSNLV